MPIPRELLTASDDWGVFLDAGGWISEQALQMNEDNFDLSQWSKVLPPLDMHLATLVHFMGTWENSGSFTYEVECWDDERTRITSALEAFGCQLTSDIWDEALAVSHATIEFSKSDEEVFPPELDARIKSINDRANDDVTYEKLANFIRQHRDEFAPWHHEDT